MNSILFTREELRKFYYAGAQQAILLGIAKRKGLADCNCNGIINFKCVYISKNMIGFTILCTCCKSIIERQDARCFFELAIFSDLLEWTEEEETIVDNMEHECMNIFWHIRYQKPVLNPLINIHNV